MLRRVAAFCRPLRPVLLLVLPPMLSGAMEVAQGDRHERRRERHGGGGGGWEEEAMLGYGLRNGMGFLGTGTHTQPIAADK